MPLPPTFTPLKGPQDYQTVFMRAWLGSGSTAGIHFTGSADIGPGMQWRCHPPYRIDTFAPVTKGHQASDPRNGAGSKQAISAVNAAAPGGRIVAVAAVVRSPELQPDPPPGESWVRSRADRSLPPPGPRFVQ
jgi:hypothetical protein